MKTGARIVTVVAILAIYAPILFAFTMMLLGRQEVQMLGEVLRGEPCSSDCSPKAVAIVLAIALPAVATWPALALVGWVWVRRGLRYDRKLKAIDRWVGTRPPVTQPDPEPEPEPQKFYRDRQGRLRPLKSAIEDDLPSE